MGKRRKKRIVLSENKSELIIEDDSDVELICFKPEDKYPFLKKQEKCDYVVELSSKVLFVELKGANFEKGINQLENTLRQLQSNYTSHEKCCLYIGRHIPSAKILRQKYKRNFEKQGVKLITRTQSCLVKTSSILECKCECV